MIEIFIAGLCIVICYMLGDRIDHPWIGVFVGAFLGPLGVFIMIIWYLISAPRRV